ncbi:MAG: hypothetical protein KDL87_11975, partial [Verrucomicrobiae bacterium]|nr:hypothetical protein [Verrucomicrobiae bacterium]
AEGSAAEGSAADGSAAEGSAAEGSKAAASTTSLADEAADSGSDSEIPEIETASAEEAAAKFQTELDSGIVRQDDIYGIVYSAAPDSPDDLKKIKGVGKVLEGKLNEIGVYHYRQIAVWTTPAVREFSNLLTSFKDRIYRDNWIAQAKQLHEEKYGEKP